MKWHAKRNSSSLYLDPTAYYIWVDLLTRDNHGLFSKIKNNNGFNITVNEYGNIIRVRNHWINKFQRNTVLICIESVRSNMKFRLKFNDIRVNGIKTRRNKLMNREYCSQQKIVIHEMYQDFWMHHYLKFQKNEHDDPCSLMNLTGSFYAKNRTRLYRTNLHPNTPKKIRLKFNTRKKIGKVSLPIK